MAEPGGRVGRSTVLRSTSIVALAITLSVLLGACSRMGVAPDQSGVAPDQSGVAPEQSGASPASSVQASAGPDPSPTIGPSAEATPSEPASSFEPSPSSEPAPSPEATPSPSEPVATPQATPTPVATPGAAGPDLAEAGWFQVSSADGGESRVLYVGRLDGRAFEVMTVPSPLEASGPADGKVLAWWYEDGETVVILVDTSDGSFSEVMRADAPFGAAALHPSGDDWYWIPAGEPDRTDGLWRRSLSGGEAEQLLPGWDSRFTRLDFAVDGSRLSISSLTPVGSRRDYKVYDVATGEVSEIVGTGHRSAIGFLGPELIVYSAAEPHEELQYPLIAIDPSDGSMREIVQGEGTFAAIFPSVDGPILVYEASEAGVYILHSLSPGDGSSRELYEAPRPLGEPEIVMVRPNEGHAVEITGWIPVFPLQSAYLGPEVSQLPLARYLVNIEDQSVIEVPPVVLLTAP